MPSPKLLLATLIFAATAHAQAPDILLHNGHIYTGDHTHPRVEALSIRGDKVLAIGTDAALVATADKHTRIIDLHGQTVIPGINDAHDHVGGAPFGVPAHTKRPPMADPSIPEVAEAVHAAALTARPGEWITAEVGPALIRHPKETRTALDTAAEGRPVCLFAWWGHGILFNSAGLAKVGIAEDVKDIPGGRYDRDADGHLTGLLEENTGNALRQRLGSQPGVTPTEIADLKAYAQRRLQQGVTSVQVMATNQKLSDLEKAFIQADTPLRLRIMRFPMPAEDALNHEELGTGDKQLTPLLRVSGVKWVLDGTPIEELAFQTKEYPDHPGWRGRPNFSVDFIDAQLKTALSGKDQLILHIVGDAMTDEVMDEMEKLAPSAAWVPLRVRFEHGDGFTTPERDARARKLGIVLAQPRPGRPFRALVAAGIPLAYGSDGGMAPWFMFTRMTDTHDPNAIPREQALKILTAGSAFAEFQERTKGTLSPGMLADLAVLSQDVMTAPTEALVRTQSVLTMIGGKIVWANSETE